MKKNLNICCFSRVNYWHGIKGGMDLHGRLLSEGLVRRGHEVSMMSTRHPNGAKEIDKNGVRFFFLPNTVYGSRRKGWGIQSLTKMLSLDHQTPFDLIWSQSFDAFGCRHLRRNHSKPNIVATLHGCIEQEILTFKRNLPIQLKTPVNIVKALAALAFSFFAVQRPLLSLCSKIITVSSQVAVDLQKWHGTHIVQKCVTIHNGVDTSRFKPDPEKRDFIRRHYGFSDHETILLSIGRLTYEKGHHLAVELLRDLRKMGLNVRLLIVGSGPAYSFLVRQVRDANLACAVTFVGQVDNDHTPDYYNASDIFVMPSLTAEGMPYVLLEAMACAKPVIASRIGGNTDVIDDGENGFLFTPGKIVELSSRVALFMKGEALSQQIGMRARKQVLNDYSLQQMITRTSDVFESLVG